MYVIYHIHVTIKCLLLTAKSKIIDDRMIQEFVDGVTNVCKEIKDHIKSLAFGASLTAVSTLFINLQRIVTYLQHIITSSAPFAYQYSLPVFEPLPIFAILGVLLPILIGIEDKIGEIQTFQKPIEELESQGLENIHSAALYLSGYYGALAIIYLLFGKTAEKLSGFGPSVMAIYAVVGIGLMLLAYLIIDKYLENSFFTYNFTQTM